MTKMYWNKMLMEAALSKAIKDLQMNPEQTLRRWYEKGSAKASKGCEPELSDQLRKLVNHPGGNYAKRIESLVKEVEPERLKTLAFNFAYYAFTLGRETAKEQELRHGVHIPFAALFEMDGTVTVSHIKSIAEQGKKLGIYTYQLFCRTDRALALLPQLFSAQKECVFLIYVRPEFVTKRLVDEWETHPNVIPFLLIKGNLGNETLDLFRSAGILYGTCLEYDAEEEKQLASGEYLQHAARMEVPLVALWPQRDVSPEGMREVSKLVRRQRLAQSFPVVPIDLVGDLLEADRLLSKEAAILYFDSKGQRLCIEEGYREGNENVFHNSFLQILEALS